jgi:hypothetical protein
MDFLLLKNTIAPLLLSDSALISGEKVDSPDSDVTQRLELTGGQGPWQTEDMEKWTDEMFGKEEKNTPIVMPGC